MLKAIHDVYSVDTFQRAKEIREMVKRDNIYEKRAASINLNADMPILHNKYSEEMGHERPAKKTKLEN